MTNLGLANGFWFALRNVCHFEPLQKAKNPRFKFMDTSPKAQYDKEFVILSE